jgi:branched-chain amino acid transport system substrate-binding protein
MAGQPDALYLVSQPTDGATIARNWISQGGVKKFMLNDGMNSEEFITNVGAEHLNEAYGTSSGVDKSASTDYFMKAYNDYSGFDWQAPAADRSYDAAAIAGLAIAAAGKAEPAASSTRRRRPPTAATTPPPSSGSPSPRPARPSPTRSAIPSAPCSTRPGRRSTPGPSSSPARWS